MLLSDLRTAFDSFYEFRRKKIGFPTSSRDFENALRELDGNFVKTDRIGEDSVIDFHNPSVNDYLDSYLAESVKDTADLIQSATFFEQFQQFWSGHRDTRYVWSDKYSGDFIAAFSRRFMALSCKVSRTYSEGRLVGMTHGNISFEHRMSLAIEIDESLATSASHSLVSQLVATLGKRIETGESNKEALVNLLPALDRRTTTSKSIFASAKQFLTGTLKEFADFDSLANFVEKFPIAIDEKELARVRQEFEEFSRHYADVSGHDPDFLRGIAEDITSVGHKLEVDVSEWADPLFQQADEIDREREREPDPVDSDTNWLDESKAIRDVDLMFEGLLREIAERA